MTQRMRAAVGVMLIAFVGAARADDYTSAEGKYTAKFPGKPKVATHTTKKAIGDLVVHFATYAPSDDTALMVSYTDFPASASKPENHATFFEGLVNGAKGSDGKLVGEVKDLSFGPDKLPGREFTIESTTEKGKKRSRLRVILNGTRLYQVAAIGPEAFVTGKDGTAFLDSFQITK